MSQTLTLVCDIIETLKPDLKKVIDPKFVSSHQKKALLDPSYHELTLLDKIDISHLEHLFDSYPKKDIMFILEAIKKDHLNPKMKEFLNQEIYSRLFKIYNLLPYKYLQAFDGSRLLFFNSHQMKLLIELLGVFDIKTFLKTSIDQKLNSDIHNSLSPHETQFLKQINREKEKVAFKKMTLETWDRSKHTFDAMKYLRGLNRLSKTVANEDLSVRQEVILRIALKEKAQFTQLSSQTDINLKKALYEELNLAIDFALSHVFKKPTQ